MPKSAKKSGKKSVQKSGKKSVKKSVQKSVRKVCSKRRLCKGLRVKSRKISGWQDRIGKLMKSASMRSTYPSATERLVAAVAKAKGRKMPEPTLVRAVRRSQRSKGRK